MLEGLRSREGVSSLCCVVGYCGCLGYWFDLGAYSFVVELIGLVNLSHNFLNAW